MSEEEEPKKKKKKGKVLARAEYALYRAVSSPVRRASYHSIDRWSGRLGRFLSRAIRPRQRLALENLARVFPEMPEEQRVAIARRCWTHFAAAALRFLRQAGEPTETLAALVKTDGKHYVNEAVARGKGLIVITAHYGDWERGLPLLTEWKVDLTVIARALDNPLLERDLYRARSRENIQVVDRRNAARPLLKTLQSGGIAIILADQAVQEREGIKVPFLGLPAWTTPAPARLALKLGSAIIFVFCEPTSDGAVDMEITPPIYPEELPESERNAEALTLRINDVLSAKIRQRPELWLWMHDRWKNA
jgi:KDO2-lipid IV(A) lauroyltransferase